MGRSCLGLSLLFRGGGRLSLRSLVMTLAGSFGGRLSWPLRCANTPADTTPSIAITKSCRINLIIFKPFLLCQYLLRMEGERVAPSRKLQERCHVLLGESLSVIAHFRTVSNFAAPYRIDASRGKPLTCRISEPVSARSTPHSDAQRADVPTAVERA